MKCVIPGANLKVFARAVHSLSKIGDELYIEALHDGLALRTVNSSRSAYACFVFVPTFFLKYDGPDKAQKDSGDSDVLKCKITIKSCLTVFKSLSTLEKTVEKCRLSLDLALNRLVFQLYCKHGIVKTYNLAFIECETLQAVFSKDFSPNILISQSRLFYDAIANFQTGQEEITLVVNPEKVVVRNYVEDEPDVHKVIRTELSLMPEEFENYRVGVDTEVTFCLKELRAILAFSEPSNLPLSMYFESAGRPIILAVDSDPSFEANFVLATLADPGTQVSSSQQSTAPIGHNVSKGNTSRKQSVPTGRAKTSHVRKPPSVEVKMRRDNNVTPAQKKDPSTFRPQPIGNKNLITSAVPSTSNSSRIEAAAKCQDTTLTEPEQIEIENDISVLVGNHGVNNTENQNLRPSTSKEPIRNISRESAVTKATVRQGEQDAIANNVRIQKNQVEADDSPVIPVEHTANDKVTLFNLNETTLPIDASDNEDEVPGTPPSKRFRSVFFGLSQSTTGGSQPSQPPPVVLAEDSEAED